MARRKMVHGMCRICGNYGELSFEHVPPYEAYNRDTVVKHAVKNWLGKGQVKGRQQQGGSGAHTLCIKCNSDTGSWYGGEYVKWSRVGFDILTQMNKRTAANIKVNEVKADLRNVYPLRFLKQVAVCLFSVINSPHAEFARNNPALVNFVLNREETRLPDECQFYLRLCAPSLPRTFLRHWPLAAKLTVSHTEDENGNIRFLPNVQASIFTEMTHPPFMLMMPYGTGFPDATNITPYKDYRYDEAVDLEINLKVGQSASPWPGGF
jgi:hypothetical protein